MSARFVCILQILASKFGDDVTVFRLAAKDKFAFLEERCVFRTLDDQLVIDLSNLSIYVM